jgi:hypothetical protein
MFGLLEAEFVRAQRELDEGLAAWCAAVSRELRTLAPNTVTTFPAMTFSDLVPESISALTPHHFATSIWGLNLDVRSAVQSATMQRWQKSNAWVQMRDSAGKHEVAFKTVIASGESRFRPIRSVPLPVDDSIFWPGPTVLLCGFSSEAATALQRAVEAIHQFNPKEWDLDGFRN